MRREPSLSFGTRRLRRVQGPYVPDSDIPPIWNPEFFGDTIVVNGRTWPVLDVEPRRYRLRVLNGCNSRFLILKVVANPAARRPADAALGFWQLGNEGGFLPAPVHSSSCSSLRGARRRDRRLRLGTSGTALYSSTRALTPRSKAASRCRFSRPRSRARPDRCCSSPSGHKPRRTRVCPLPTDPAVPHAAGHGGPCPPALAQ